jgi:hypothetical protein
MSRPDVKNFRWSPKMTHTAESRKGMKLSRPGEQIQSMLKRRITLPKVLHTGTRTWKSVKEKLDEELVYTET